MLYRNALNMDAKKYVERKIAVKDEAIAQIYKRNDERTQGQSFHRGTLTKLHNEISDA